MNGENIKEIRELKGISRKQLADKVGITESAIFRYETNQREPRFSILCKMSETLEVPVDKIINPIYGKKSIDDLIEAGEVGKHIAEIKNKEEQEINLLYNFLKAKYGEENININPYFDEEFIKLYVGDEVITFTKKDFNKFADHVAKLFPTFKMILDGLR